ncbi:MAG TPA: pitrilysin family protein [Bryobacteraceae bacterium]|nr:pitrilysin family protein [Bryobacteraceae bacterium]
MNLRSSSALLMAVVLTLGSAFSQDLSQINIPFEKIVLPNGLTVLVHEDRKTPIVAVNVWYHVGSKNELKGRTGFAHLFEHLMFNGSENFNHDYFKVLEKIGATDLNGTTNEDRTNYFQNVPTSALDTVLWMESDRMGHMLGVVDQARLDEQRGVVQNEKRQGENEPYGMVWSILNEKAFPAGHPYSWSVIGSMEDLSAATLQDVKDWFKKYYGPSNAVLVLAGDIDVKTAREKVEKYFGHIPPGEPLTRPAEWIAKRTEARRVVLEDRVPQSRIYKQWNIPSKMRKDADHLQLVSSILGGGKTSRLYKRLVYKDQIATDAGSFVDSMEIAGSFIIIATAKPGGDMAAVEKAINEEVARFVAEGPTAEELDRAKTTHLAGFLRGLERIGGFGGKSDILATGLIYTGNPEHFRVSLQNMNSATAADVKKAAADWLASGALDIAVVPFPTLKPSGPDVDRKKVPEPGTISDARFPKLERFSLNNGLKVILAERHSAPLVNMALAVDSGFASDQMATPGTAKLAMAVLEEGTKTRTSEQISEQLEGLGAQLNTGVNLDTAFVSLSALKSKLDPSLDIFVDVVRNPAFPESDFRREQQKLLAAIQQEKTEPFSMAQRLVTGFIYGKGHPYAAPGTGSGTEASVKSITRETLQKFHTSWFHPNNATLIIVGDTTAAEIKPKLEKLFGAWPQGKVAKLELPKVEHQEKAVVYLMDRPGALQSNIIATHVAPPRFNPDEIAFRTLNTALGGSFMSRINMNLREDKHWSYGAGSYLMGARGQRPFMVYAPVQTDKTKESLVEMQKELKEVLLTRPIADEELAQARDAMTLRLAGSRETSWAVLNNILELVQYGLPDDYFDTFAAKVRALGKQDISTAAEKLIRPDKLTWVVVGDRAKIEQGVRDLKIGEVKLIDADGNLIN